jgi:uncharacterized BrkB/YihY/UPF0761 family membrane protein
MMTAFRTIWEPETADSYVRGKIVDIAVVLGTGIAVIVGFGLSMVVDAVYEVGSGHRLRGRNRKCGWMAGWAVTSAATLGLIFGCFAALYRLLPTTALRWEALWPGAAFGAIGFQCDDGL